MHKWSGSLDGCHQVLPRGEGLQGCAKWTMVLQRTVEEGRDRAVLCSMSQCCTCGGEEEERREEEEEWVERGKRLERKKKGERKRRSG